MAQSIGFVITGAGSMLAEAVHAFADAGNQAPVGAKVAFDPELSFVALTSAIDELVTSTRLVLCRRLATFTSSPTSSDPTRGNGPRVG